MQRRIFTADRLLRFGMQNQYFCPLCRRNLETPAHLFAECPWARQVWERTALLFHCPAIGAPDGDDRALSWAVTKLAASDKRAASLIILVAWEIWRERNRRVFCNKELTVSGLTHLIADEANSWVLAGARHLVRRE
jgi:predicted amidophosphoribosyltransferase